MYRGDIRIQIIPINLFSIVYPLVILGFQVVTFDFKVEAKGEGEGGGSP